MPQPQLNKLTEDKRKRKVELTSSHSDNENDDGPLAACSTEGSAVSELYKLDDGIPRAFRYVPKADVQLISEEIYIPDVG
jgi:hypothetical protein